MTFRPGLAKYSVILPAKALADGLDTIELRYAWARTPREVISKSADVRQLAAAWYSIDFAARSP